MALLSPYAQFRIFSICIVVWKVLEYKHTSLRRRSSFEELKCLLLYNRWSMSKSLNYSWHAEAFKQLAKALLCSSHPIFLLTVILKGYFRYFLSIMQVLSFSFFFVLQFEANFQCQQKFFPPLLSNSETMKKWKYYFRLSLKRVELFENFPFSFFSPSAHPPFICSLEMKLARSKNFFSSAVSTSFIANLIGMFDVFYFEKCLLNWLKINVESNRNLQTIF